jgi:hypothetical protein
MGINLDIIVTIISSFPEFKELETVDVLNDFRSLAIPRPNLEVIGLDS